MAGVSTILDNTRTYLAQKQHPYEENSLQSCRATGELDTEGSTPTAACTVNLAMWLVHSEVWFMHKLQCKTKIKHKFIPPSKAVPQYYIEWEQ